MTAGEVPAPGAHVEHARVAWVDTDASGAIHFTAAFRFAEVAETGLRRALGLTERWGSYPRRHVEADFLKMLRFGDEIEISIAAGSLGASSIVWQWQIARQGETCVIGETVVVHVNDQSRPAQLPDDVRARLLEAFPSASTESRAAS